MNKPKKPSSPNFKGMPVDPACVDDGVQINWTNYPTENWEWTDRWQNGPKDLDGLIYYGEMRYDNGRSYTVDLTKIPKGITKLHVSARNSDSPDYAGSLTVRCNNKKYSPMRELFNKAKATYAKLMSQKKYSKLKKELTQYKKDLKQHDADMKKYEEYQKNKFIKNEKSRLKKRLTELG